MKNNKGITLIALVITIIVLLILAGITIAMLTGENGLLNKANDAKITDMEAAATEKVKLAVAAANLEMQTKLVTNSSYDPQTATVSASDTTNAILKLIEDDLTPSTDWSVVAVTTGSGTSLKTTGLTVTFQNPEYVSAKGSSKVYNVSLHAPSATDANGITVSY